jgi:hypothetical protein
VCISFRTDETEVYSHQYEHWVLAEQGQTVFLPMGTSDDDALPSQSVSASELY